MANKSVTVRPSGGTYTTLQAAITGEVTANADLTAGGLDGILTIQVEGDWSGGADTTACVVTGFTCDSTHYVNIVTDTANRAGTAWDANKYVQTRSTATYFPALTLTQAYLRVTGLQVVSSGTGEAVYTTQANIIDSCFGVSSGGGNGFNTESSEAGNILVFANCIGKGAEGFASQNSVEKIYYYNCITGNNSSYGFRTAQYDLQYMINCYSGGNAGADYFDNGGSATTYTTCFSEDGTKSTSTAVFTTDTFTSITAGSEDYTLVSGSGLIDQGTDLSSDAVFPFNWDITNTTRTGTWDVGVYELQAGGDAEITGAGGITSAEAFGTPALSVNVVSTGIASSEAFGSPAISALISSTGIVSSEAFGQPAISANITASGITSAEAFGSPAITLDITSTGIVSSEAFGNPALSVVIESIGIISGEDFGTPAISATINSTGIASDEAFGNPAISVNIVSTGIVSSETFGQPLVYIGDLPASITGAGGIVSLEAFGTPAITYVPMFESVAGNFTFTGKTNGLLFTGETNNLDIDGKDNNLAMTGKTNGLIIGGI